MHDLDTVAERIVRMKPLEPLSVVSLRPVDPVADRLEVRTHLLELSRRVDLNGRMRLAPRHWLLDPEMDLGATGVAEPSTTTLSEFETLCDLGEAETLAVEVAPLVLAARRARDLHMMDTHGRT